MKIYFSKRSLRLLMNSIEMDAGTQIDITASFDQLNQFLQNFSWQIIGSQVFNDSLRGGINLLFPGVYADKLLSESIRLQGWLSVPRINCMVTDYISQFRLVVSNFFSFRNTSIQSFYAWHKSKSSVFCYRVFIIQLSMIAFQGHNNHIGCYRFTNCAILVGATSLKIRFVTAVCFEPSTPGAIYKKGT